MSAFRWQGDTCFVLGHAIEVPELSGDLGAVLARLVQMERERCAKIAESFECPCLGDACCTDRSRHSIAAEIRSGE